MMGTARFVASESAYRSPQEHQPRALSCSRSSAPRSDGIPVPQTGTEPESRNCGTESGIPVAERNQAGFAAYIILSGRVASTRTVMKGDSRRDHLTARRAMSSSASGYTRAMPTRLSSGCSTVTVGTPASSGMAARARARGRSRMDEVRGDDHQRRGAL